ncbi:MAG: hypothetical protein HN337_04445 [Deltaproteobacteria bacterium]|jgi:hypothetical protein|nr:hypothetical protein [Deltaproteobacteria bacterium]
MARIKICKDRNCKNAATTKGYCRLHYLRNWRVIKEVERERSAKKLNAYINYICKKHPDRYMDIIKENLRSSNFDKDIEREFGFDDPEELSFDDSTYEDEIERLIDELKIEKGF